MFEKMTQREKTLALIVGSLVPIAIVFMALIWFVGSYNSNEITIIGLRRDVNLQKDKLDQRNRALLRKNYYQEISFPTDADQADVDYQFWLGNTVERTVKMQLQGLSRVEGIEVKFGKDKVYSQNTYKLTARGTLDQLTHFLAKFYELPMMHRINKINATPRTAGTVGEKQLIRTGQHSFIISIDVLAMKDAAETRDFTNEAIIPLKRSLDDYNKKIVFRNIFGPANNTPVVEASGTSSYPLVDVKFPLVGQDADEADLLTFKLVDCDIPGAEIVVSDPESRTVQFSAPGLEVGVYEFKVEVADNGYPPKSSVTDVKLDINQRPNSRPAFVTSSSLEAVAGEEIVFEIEGEDSDESNKLAFEFIELDDNTPQFEGISMEPAGDNKVKVVATPVETGSYQFRLKITDDAEKPLFAERTFRVKVEPPKFSFASQTQVTGVLNSSKGDMCWINVRPTGAFHKLVVGDSFEVDRKQWSVHSIKVAENEIWLQQGSKMYRFKRGDFLSNPREEKPNADPIASAPVSKKESQN